ncbi:MAG: hypothetical protein D6737_03750 [Chloroflexi bacterium]|nr:MAG: hypothetical protein CUN54_05465 [Phototrophicales bacterium]RMF81830.1 MAG: hypothetical protein D6737_03750 [Chloroflexota bacterium]
MIAKLPELPDLPDLNFNNLFVQTVLAVVVGTLLGLVALATSPKLAIVVVLSLVGAVIFSKYPEYAFLAMIVTVATVYDHTNTPLIPLVAGMDLQVIDVVWLFMLGKMILDLLIRRDRKYIHTPLDIPMLIFLIVGAISTMFAVTAGTIDFSDEANAELRLLAYFAFFFAITNLINRPVIVDRAIRGFHFLAALVGLLMLIQFVMGPENKIIPGRVEELRTATEVTEDVSRILTPGQSIILVSFISLTTFLLLDGFKPRHWLIMVGILLTGAGVIITFNRNFWAVVLLAFAVTFIMGDWRAKDRIVKTAIVGVPAFFIAAIIILSSSDPSAEPSLIHATLSRFTTLFSSDTTQESSLQFRFIENEYAAPYILPPSPFGEGLGFKYRPWDLRLDWFKEDGSVGSDLRDYIHNGHFWILIKMGFLGYGAFMWFSLLMIYRGLKYWRRVPGTQRQSILLSFSITYLGMLVATIVNPTFFQVFWIVVYVFMAAISETIIRWGTTDESNTQTRKAGLLGSAPSSP